MNPSASRQAELPKELPGSYASPLAGLSLRQAAWTAALCYLLNPVLFSEAYAMPRLVSDSGPATLASITAHPRLFGCAIVAYFVSLLGDVIMAWALYVLLAPVNRALSLLASVFQWVYAAFALAVISFLAIDFRMVTVPELQSLLPEGVLAGIVRANVSAFRAGWSLSLGLFGIHLCLLGWLIWSSRYPARWVGLVLLPDGAAWMIAAVAEYVAPRAQKPFIQVFYLGEIILIIWLFWLAWHLRKPLVRYSGTNFT